jgi:hypothetical protein
MIAASSTASNAQSAIMASRAITEPMFYFMERYVENVLKKMANGTKLSWVLLKSKRAEIILGSERAKWLRVTPELLNDEYDTYVSDGRKEMDIRQMITRYGEFAINAKEMRVMDMVKASMAETAAEAYNIMATGWETVEKIRQEDMAKQQKGAMEQTQAQLEGQRAMMKEDREDRQQQERIMPAIKEQAKIVSDTTKAKNQMLLDQNNAEQSQEPPIM